MKIISTNQAPAAIGPYSQAIVVNGMVYTSGQIPINPKNGLIEAQSIQDQTEQVITNLKAVLQAAGTSIDKVVKTTCFLKDMADFGAFNEVYARHFVSLPARSCVAAKQLPRDVSVEIEVIATV